MKLTKVVFTAALSCLGAGLCMVVIAPHSSLQIPNLVVSFLAAIWIIRKIQQPLVKDNLVLNAVATGLIALAIGVTIRAGVAAFEVWNLHDWIDPFYKWMHQLDTGTFATIVVCLCVLPVVSASCLIPFFIEKRRAKESTATTSTTPAPRAPYSSAGDKHGLKARTITVTLPKYTFADVGGCYEAKEEMEEIIWQLANPGQSHLFGAKPIKGVLMTGDPGNGKTILAEATAGEAQAAKLARLKLEAAGCDSAELEGGKGKRKGKATAAQLAAALAEQARVPFYALAGSDFVEMFVGVGSSRVREVFALAKQTGGLIFIDEFDAAGGQRGGGANNKEHDTTVNAILHEMDGVGSDDGVILVAATNLPDTIDTALLRPGRFDRIVHVAQPNRKARKEILAIHLRDKPLDSSLSLEEVLELMADKSTGSSGALLMGACEEGARMARRKWDAVVAAKVAGGQSLAQAKLLTPKAVHVTDLVEGLQKARYGAVLRAVAEALSPSDKLNSTYHEACHAVVAEELDQPVHMITILPRGKTGGMVESLPTPENEMTMSDEQYIKRICTAMAGRVGTEVFLNRKDSGTRSDFFQANGMARSMVVDLGLTEAGHLSSGNNPMASGQQAPVQFGPDLLNEIDRISRGIVEDCKTKAEAIVLKYRRFIEEAIKPVLMHDETILRPQWLELWEGRNEFVQTEATSEV